MITSGYLIGQIIDEFSTLGEQGKLRNTLGLSDISVYSENFFRDILNIIFDYQLINTNEDRSNEPGLDLGDESKKIAFQVTTTKTSAKIKKTLTKITEVQRNKYDRFVVLIIGEKQQSYDAVETALKERNISKIDDGICFDIEKDIIDLNNLCRKIVGMSLPKIQQLHEMIKNQMAQVKIELQVKDQEGNYETSGYDLWEPLPETKYGNGLRFAAWISKISDQEELSEEETNSINEAIKDLSRRLLRLPRITREFFAMLHERSEYQSFRFREYPSIFLDVVNKTYPSAKNELALLTAQNLVYVNYDPYMYDENIPAEIGLQMGSNNENFKLSFHEYVSENELSFRKILSELDFSDF